MLGVAKAQFTSKALPDQQHDFQFEFLGLVALADPVRPAVPGAVQECQTAGIRVIMITGDYPGTAMSIARQIGLQNAEKAIPVRMSRPWMSSLSATTSRGQACSRVRFPNRNFS